MTARKSPAQLKRLRRQKMQAAEGIPEEVVTGTVAVATADAERGVAPGPVTYRRGHRFVRMYEPATGRARDIPSHTVLTARLGGLLMECPFCEDEHESSDPNACPVLAKVPFRVCKVCEAHGRRKVFYDEGARVRPATAAPGQTDELDLTPGEDASTPAMRLKIAWGEHMLAYHPPEAEAAGLGLGRRR